MPLLTRPATLHACTIGDVTLVSKQTGRMMLVQNSVVGQP